MINPIGFSPVRFGRVNNYRKPRNLRPLEETSPETQAMKTSSLYSQIEAINEKIGKLEEHYHRADKTDATFDRTAALQEIGRLINQKAILETKIREEIAAQLEK